ncbi:MAG: 3-isopropylmalate dehydratase small subunit [Leptospirillum sp. Group II 'C75']|jgi:3-isopropylmalate/(R)-2-methylmalate dehydratase small subunit|uniref:3-isopropylmalate dehydratase small subunit n=3 Tax=Leptospirillum ferriphilum TaxID=178606 RepID=A0A059XNL4_9BACT|nr:MULTISPECIES: 3-isopropylmalate dehydratase small subunit [Leptospirillum]EAY57503.1 MAG: 3-isopropylmalate dehydratase small subunit [Leptospirillum rubarum]EIJ75818.1 MAG: 3-isopropylmalate dehydratase small subunit [Leptospirillum sp. Group II 'C75']AFS52956.1 3-isopropylmalate dehydratase small subunit [Leptospirillum ferriphilum ML-04]AIA30124.1 3-isopropylmalate dehydratase [Leptospirillum ferriphilum YSK]AKS22995.1 3-isopropylmalate dehydratase [Leptospirillum sp. Group II 'CF-1']
MEPFKILEAVAAPIDRANIDTDAIIPKQFLKTIKRTGLGVSLFYDWRYLEDGKTPNPDFVLNQERYKNANILVTRQNFGSGSSREHAPWALLDFGIRSILAPSFADIFYNNCFKNGILPVRLPEDRIDRLFREIPVQNGYRITIDLPSQAVILPDGTRWTFEIDPFRKKCLLEGLDDIGLTLAYKDQIAAYEKRRKEEAPWLFSHPNA